MKTIKRMPVDIKVSGLSNMNKYFNQMQFNGIKKDDNIYAIDQMSLRDANNVYIDDNLRLVSRPTLQYSDLPPEIPAFSELVDIKDFGSGKVYITKSVLNKYSVIILPNTPVTPIVGATFIIEELTNYHIATIEHYVICFNNANAKIFDTNNADQGWQNLTNYAEVPVVKRYVGNTLTEFEKNNFIPNLYREEYVWTTESHPELPGIAPSGITLKTPNAEYKQLISDIYNLPEYRILKPTNMQRLGIVDALSRISIAKNIICIAHDTYFKISFNKGESFESVYYPFYYGLVSSIQTISEDGKYFFFVATSGVYRCNLADFTWSKVFKPVDENGTEEDINVLINPGTGKPYENNHFCFKTGDIFAFFLNEGNKLYFKGPGLYSGDNCTNDHTYKEEDPDDFYHFSYITQVPFKVNRSDTPTTIDITDLNILNPWNGTSISIYVDNYKDKQVASFGFSFRSNYTGQTLATIIYCHGGDTSLETESTYMYTMCYSIDNCFAITLYEGLEAKSGATGTNLLLGSNFKAVAILNPTPIVSWQEINNIHEEKVINFLISRYTPSGSTTANDYFDITVGEVVQLPNGMSAQYDNQVIPIGGTYILKGYIRNTVKDEYYDRYDWLQFPTTINDKTIVYERTTNMGIWAYDGNIYMVAADRQYQSEGYQIWTNALSVDDLISIIYTRGSAGNFTRVPSVSYSDTQLYLGFDNLLQITNNSKDPGDPTKTLFNLPDINNQSFIDKITAMINISTSEIAIFFLNKIIVCAKVEDATFGFRYDYYNTKLSTGVRLGDSVINTLEGSFTLFPTLRGLAAMNYQAFMATTDQTISYITDTVKDMWTKFYNDSEQIRIIQWRNRLVLTNGTGTILLYDLTTQAWWRWELNRDVLVALSNQLDLQVINGTLLTFKENVDQYYDFGERGEFSEINWYIMSQPLHFNAPNYYKNIKQLVFQMSETEDEKSTKTMDAQIKLYRKKITIRELETVKFKIEELRTFVKRFNYWKINELQWGISNDTETSTPKRLELNGMSVKYEIGEEVR